MFKKIELDAPCVGTMEKEYLCKAIDSGFISTFGPYVPEFETKMADYLGIKSCVAVQSGTAAIYMALYQLGIGHGDEVIVPALTFTATVNPVLYVGATPVIVDVDEMTWNINPEKIMEAVTQKTKAIIPVHLYGNPCDMVEIMKIAGQHKLRVIEDATESLGAKVNNKDTGGFGDFGCLSFNGNKLISTGGGGMVVSNDAEQMDRIRYLINQAKDKDKAEVHSEMGFNYRMTNIEAALGLAQMEKISAFLDKKRSFRKIYQNALSDLPFVRFQEPHPTGTQSHWFTCMRIIGERRLLDIMEKLKEKGVPVRRIFAPIGTMPYLTQYSRNCSSAVKIFNSGLCLPSSTLNAENDIKDVASIIREVLGG